MQLEIKVALNFIISYLYNKLPRRRADLFGEELERLLKKKYEGHWYPDKPLKGSGFRCVHIGEIVDPVVELAAKRSGLAVEDVRANVPEELSVWIDPFEVSYQIGEKGAVKVLYVDDSEGCVAPELDKEIKSSFNPDAQVFVPIGSQDSSLSNSPSPSFGQSPSPTFIPRSAQPITFTTASFAATKFGSTDRGPESRPTELSLEELSISSRPPGPPAPAPPAAAQAPAPAPGPRPGTHPEEAPPRPSRKRKLLEDTESGKTLLLDAYRVWQQGQKGVACDLGRIERVMSETYMLLKQVDEEAALEQAVKFCQAHLGAAAQRQAAGDMPTTPKHPKDTRENVFPAATAPAAPESTPADAPPRPNDGHAKPRPASATASTPDPAKDPGPPRPHRPEAAPSTSSLRPGAEEPAGGTEGPGFPPQEPRGSEHVKTAPEGPEAEAAPRTGTQPACSQVASSEAPGGGSAPCPEGPPGKAEPGRAKSRLLPNMPKLVIPSSTTKFPPEITVTPPTPTLLSPKGSISEETKQKLKSAILSAQSAATVRKESLCQPALEVLETSSQESSLESETDEDEDYMDI